MVNEKLREFYEEGGNEEGKGKDGQNKVTAARSLADADGSANADRIPALLPAGESASRCQ